MTRRILGMALCFALTISLLPFGAFAANQGAYSLDLQSGSAAPAVAEGKLVVQTLNMGADKELIGRKIDSEDLTKVEARFDLDKNGTYDLGVGVTRSLKGDHPIIKTVFTALDTTNLSGDKTFSIPGSGSGDYYSPLTLRFPKKMASLTAKVMFDPNGGTGDMADVTVVKNTDYTLPECTFTAPDGKEFDKWNLGAAGESVKITTDIVVTAQWKDKDTSPKNIDSIELTFVNTDLKAGQKPVFEARLSDESAAVAVIKEEVWTDRGDSVTLSSLGTDKTITEGHSYSYSIALEPKEGYVFTDYTGLKYKEITYAQSAIGADLDAGGTGLKFWDFIKDVEVLGESVDRLEVDLTKGGTIVTEPRCTALADTLIGANAVKQAKYNDGTIDLDMDGTADMAFDKDSGVVKLQPAMSLTGDVTLTLNDEGINYVTEKLLTPYAKEVEFKFAPAEKTYALDLSAGQVTLTDDEGLALISTLQADENGGLLTLDKVGDAYDVDLDKDGTKDMKVSNSAGGVTADPLESSSIEDSITLDSPLYYIIPLAGSDDPYLTQLKVLFKESVEVKDLGNLTVDLSKEKTVTVTSEEYGAFRASLTGLEAKETVKSKTEGDVISVDLDKDGKFDIEVNGVRAFSLTEDCSLTKDTTITLSEDEIAAIDTASYKEYYKTITVKISGEAPGENPFTDVKEGDYFYDAVLWAFYADPQVTDGMTDTTFGPYLTVTRGQCVTFLWRAMGKPEPTTDKNPFTDVPADQYYYKAVLWAVEKGITDGMTDTTFEPNTTLSTAHITTFLFRTLGVGTDGWYQEAADWAVKEKLLDGMNLMVAPNVDCPRGAVVTFLYRELSGKS